MNKETFIQDLLRMSELNERIEQEVAEDSDFKEYREIKDRVMEDVMPLVELIREAGLLTIWHEKTQTGYEVTNIWDNGCCYLSAGERVHYPSNEAEALGLGRN